MTGQFTLDGGEETPAAVTDQRAPFTEAQMEILRLIAHHDITSTDAGRILHAYRDNACKHCQAGTCPYAASDGGDALKRLQKRGFVRRLAPGLWTARKKRWRP
jgi:hypothetical protein